MAELNRKSLLPRLCASFCFVLLMVLAWRWQRIFFEMCNDYIISDVPAHIKLALGNNDYGLSSYIIKLLYALFPEHRALTALSMILAFNVCVGVLTLWLLIRRMFPELDGNYSLLAVVLAHLCGPWIIPGAESQMGMYLGVFNGNVYHNMTVLFSRTFIPLCFLFFFPIWDERHGKISPLPWLGLTLSFLLATLFKPNFAFAFIPMLGGWLIYDFIKTKGKNFKNEFFMGLTVVPAGLACIWQYLVLFDDNFAGTSSSMSLRILTAAQLITLAIMYIRGMLLPLYTLSTQGRREKGKGEHIALILCCTAIAIFEALILTETGFRANDGNFDWGALSLYPTLFALGIALQLRMMQQADCKNKGDVFKVALGIVLLLGHLIVGVYCLQQPGNAGYDWFYF